MPDSVCDSKLLKKDIKHKIRFTYCIDSFVSIGTD